MTKNLLNLAKWIKSYGISKVKDLKLSLSLSIPLSSIPKVYGMW